jgi:hypothetical protein
MFEPDRRPDDYLKMLGKGINTLENNSTKQCCHGNRNIGRKKEFLKILSGGGKIS